MKKTIITSAFIFLVHISFGQDFIKVQDSVHTSVKSSIDSLSEWIDFYRPYFVMNDTFRITDVNDPSKTVGFVIDQFYLDIDGKLKKTILYNYNVDRRTYYFSDSALVKVIIRDLSNTVLKTFYYSKDDNGISSYAISRVIKLYPELRDYYDNLEIGRSYLRQKSKAKK